MIQKADDSMRQELLDWLRMDEPVNLPVIGSIGRHGLSADYHEAWVQRNRRGRWTALIQRLNGHITLCATNLRGGAEELVLFLRFADPLSVSGARHIIRRIQPALDGYCEESFHHMVLPEGNALEFLPRAGSQVASGLAASVMATADLATVDMAATDMATAGLAIVDMATADDAEEIGTLIFETESFRQEGRSAAEVADGIRTGILSGGVRHIVMRLGGGIVSHACTTVETNDCALISGVTTRYDAQRRGYASCLVSCLCRQLLAEGRHPGLFCGEPAARALYLKLGFREQGKHIMLRKH